MPHMSSTSSSSSSAPSAVSHQYHPHHQQQREHHTNHYGHPNQQPTHLNSNSKPVKIKRTRQRVDAGEPRNSYASIANFSSRGGYHGHHNKHGGSNSNSNNNSNQSNNYHHNQSSNNNHGISNSSNTNSNGINHPHSLERSHSIGSWPSNHANPHYLSNTAFQNQSSSIDSVIPYGGSKSAGSMFPFGGSSPISFAQRSDSFQSMMDANLLQQFCQNPMSALFSGAYAGPYQSSQHQAQQQSIVESMSGIANPKASSYNKLPMDSSSSLDPSKSFQLQNNLLYNTTSVFLNQLQQHSASSNLDNIAMVNHFINNLQNEAINNQSSNPNQSLFNPSVTFDAQLLRDILESNTKSNEKTQLAIQQVISNKLSHLIASSSNHETIESQQHPEQQQQSQQSEQTSTLISTSSSSSSSTSSKSNHFGSKIINKRFSDPIELLGGTHPNIDLSMIGLSMLDQLNEQQNQCTDSGSQSQSNNARKLNRFSSSSTISLNLDPFNDSKPERCLNDENNRNYGRSNERKSNDDDPHSRNTERSAVEINNTLGSFGEADDNAEEDDEADEDDDDDDDLNEDNVTAQDRNDFGTKKMAEAKKIIETPGNPAQGSGNNVANQNKDGDKNDGNNNNNTNGNNAVDRDGDQDREEKREEKREKQKEEEEEEAKIASVSDGNLLKEERRRGRGRPPLHSIAQRRSKCSSSSSSLMGGRGGETNCFSSALVSLHSIDQRLNDSGQKSAENKHKNDAGDAGEGNPGTISLDRDPEQTRRLRHRSQNQLHSIAKFVQEVNNTNLEQKESNRISLSSPTSSTSSSPPSLPTSITPESLQSDSFQTFLNSLDHFDSCLTTPSGVNNNLNNQQLIHSNHNHHHRVQSETVLFDDNLTNMLLETTTQPVSNHHHHLHHNRLSPASMTKGDDDETIEQMDQTLKNASSATQGVNGCKKRKLYQPQQTSRLLNGSYGIDEDEIATGSDGDRDDLIENDRDDDDRMSSSAAIEIENISVEAELDEGYEESGEDRNQKSSSIANGDKDVSNKIDETKMSKEKQESDLSLRDNGLNVISNNNQILLNGRTSSNSSNSNHHHSKRARQTDLEREFYKAQRQLLQKYNFSSSNTSNNNNGNNFPSPKQQSPFKSMSNGVGASSTNHLYGNNFARTSPVNLTAPQECDILNESLLNDVKDQQQNQLNSIYRSHSTASMTRMNELNEKTLKIEDVDSFVDSITTSLMKSIGPIIQNSIRTHLEAQNIQRSTSTDGRLDAQNHSDSITTRTGDILARMLDIKYSRNEKLLPLTVASPNNGTKNSAPSPFSMLPSEASPTPKPFGFSPNQLNSFYSKSNGLFPAPNFALNAYSNARDSTVTLNGVRESQSSKTPTSSASTVASTLLGRDNASPILPEQTEAMSLVVGTKKRRNKVTDTRLTPRTITRIPREDGRETASISPPLSNGQMNFSHNSLGGGPVSLASLHHANDFFDPINQSASTFPLSEQTRLSSFFNADDVDQIKNGLTTTNSNGADPSVVSAVAQAAAVHHLKMLSSNRASPDSLNGYSGSLFANYPQASGSENGSETNDTQSMYDSIAMTSTLSPMHLRKAKLMFFYVRYPSSSILKMFFPDIKFNKNNTAQLVKWFSNFREFYYIQMEKYARQAISEGVKNDEDLHVTDDSELLRVLNLHYNRSNHIPIPDNFRQVSQTTLREFFKSLQQNKDSEQSWKKAIYKVIARLDDNVPEEFKNPDFMEQLE
ncbi:5'-AMP-activated protein kinase subunit beta-2-like [Sarcoptes scabiei]|nr:5'-AMP-activated protein kinase subunit beta-2-like [Sarcoptes scabiei]